MGSATVNGPLWGERVADWAELPEARTAPLFEAVYTHGRLRPGESCLDLACGAGLASRLAAARGARASGVDASAAMIAYARAHRPEARFEVADLEALPFPPAAFDLVTSFNGIQYASSLDLAMNQVRRMLKPGGRFAVAVWDANCAMATVITALRPLLPAPPPTAPGPFALSGRGVLAGLAIRAGLEPGETFVVNVVMRYPDLDAAVRGMNSSGVAARARAQSGEEAVSRAHAESLKRFHAPGGEVVMDAAFQVMIARAPAVDVTAPEAEGVARSASDNSEPAELAEPLDEPDARGR